MQPPAHAGSSLADFSTLKMEAIRSSETSVESTRSIRRHIPEYGILQNHKNWSSLPAGILTSFPCKWITFRKRVREAVTSKDASGRVWLETNEVIWSVLFRVQWNEHNHVSLREFIFLDLHCVCLVYWCTLFCIVPFMNSLSLSVSV
jgi:hypothetical protein